MMNWRFAAGQAMGSSHEKLGKPCQDRMSCVLVADPLTLIAVVADGAGTAAQAHLGAEIAVATVSSIAQLGVRAGRTDFKDLLREGARLARERLVEAAQDKQVAPRDLACTLLAAIVAPIGGAALQIGDGAIVIAEEKPAWRHVFWPQKGEYANTTFFLSDEQALAQAAVADLPDEALDIALFSDGMEPLALHFASQSAHEPFFRTVFAPLHASRASGEDSALSQGLTQLLVSPQVRARTDDDVTLVLGTRRVLP
jgi:hypothetical protein